MLHDDELLAGVLLGPGEVAELIKSVESFALVEVPCPEVVALDIQPDPRRPEVVIGTSDNRAQESSTLPVSSLVRIDDHASYLDHALGSTQSGEKCEPVYLARRGDEMSLVGVCESLPMPRQAGGPQPSARVWFLLPDSEGLQLVLGG